MNDSVCVSGHASEAKNKTSQFSVATWLLCLFGFSTCIAHHIYQLHVYQVRLILYKQELSCFVS